MPDYLDPESLRARLLQMGTQPNPRLTTPLTGPPQPSPAQEIRANIAQYANQPNPRLAATAGSQAGEAVDDVARIRARLNPGAGVNPNVAAEQAGPGSVRQWLNTRFATPGAQTPGEAARAAMEAGKRGAQGVGNVAGQTVSKLNAGGWMTGLGRAAGVVEAGMGINDAINDPNLVQGRPWLHAVNADAADKMVLGAATALNPGIGAIGNLARVGRDAALEQGINLAYRDNTAGPALQQTLGGRTPAEYLAQRQATTAQAADTEPTPKFVSQADLLALASPEDRRMLEANIRANPLDRGGIQYQKDGRMYLASLRALNDPAQAGPIARAATAMPASTRGGAGDERPARQGGGMPKLVSNENGTGYQLLHPNGEREDTVHVMYGADGGYIQSMDPAGYKIWYGRGEAPGQAVQRFFKQKAVEDQIGDKLAAGEPIPNDLIKSYYLAQGYDPKELLHNEASVEGEKIRAGGAENAANIAAGERKYATDINAQLTREGAKEKLKDKRFTHMKTIYDQNGMPVGQEPVTVDLETGETIGGQKAKVSTPSPASIERLRKNAKNATEVQLFESAYGPGSAAQYLQAEKPKGYAKGGLIRRYSVGGEVNLSAGDYGEDELRGTNALALEQQRGQNEMDALRYKASQNMRFAKGGPIRRYAKGGPVDGENDYQAGDTPEDYALRTNQSTPAVSAFGAPMEYFGSPTANLHANPAFGRSGDERFARGGPVRGPGTGTSDSIPALIDGKRPAAISDGEYVIPAAVVKRKGKQFFDDLLAEHQAA